MKSVKPSVDIPKGPSTGVQVYVSAPHLIENDKEPGPSWGKQLPGERPRETTET
jgi:hypothetical protein